MGLADDIMRHVGADEAKDLADLFSQYAATGNVGTRRVIASTVAEIINPEVMQIAYSFFTKADYKRFLEERDTNGIT